MKQKSILLLDNLLRAESRRSQCFFYTILRECLHQAGGNISPCGSDQAIDRGLKDSFRLDTFIDKCDLSHWSHGYHEINQEAQNYLTDHLPEDAVAIGYEMPPWLTSILDRAGIPYITFQVSPLRFGRDLYVAIRGSIPSVSSTASRIAVKDDELFLEAALMRARVQHVNHKRGNSRESERLVFVGQTGTDASLLTADGRILDARFYAEEIRNATSSLPLAYKPHPYAGSFARREKRVLEDIVGYRVPRVGSNIYTVLASEPRSSILTISSGVGQEAKYFRRQASILHHPVCEVHTTDGPIPPGAHQQIHFSDFCSPRFWERVLSGEGEAIAGARFEANEFRHAFGKWWGYDTYMVDNDPFWRLMLTGSVVSLAKRFRSYLLSRMELRSRNRRPGANAPERP